MRNDTMAVPRSGSLDGLARLARWCAFASGAVSILGIAFLVAFFTVGGVYGPLNDIAVIVHYTLMLPIVVLVHRLVRPFAPRLSQVSAVIGFGSILAVIVLQALLVAGVLPFRRQIVLVIPAFLAALMWFVLTGSLGRRTEWLPKGTLLYILAGLYIGYPVWAFSLGRRLRYTTS